MVDKLDVVFVTGVAVLFTAAELSEGTPSPRSYIASLLLEEATTGEEITWSYAGAADV